MKRKHDSGNDLSKDVGVERADEWRDCLLESEEFLKVIENEGEQPNLALPQDWVALYHKSGGIVYLDRKTRVCTWSRPYHIGTASVRKHNVPTAAIPCLHQSLALQKKLKINSDVNEGASCGNSEHLNSKNNHCIVMDDEVKADSMEIGDALKEDGLNNLKNHKNCSDYSGLEMLSFQDIETYLGHLWKFNNVPKKEGSKLLFSDGVEDTECKKNVLSTLKTIPYLIQGTNSSSNNDENFVINPAGKSALSLLHEYCMKKQQAKPEFVVVESGIPKTPFQAKVLVNGLEYGKGVASSKKQAKHLAAQRTLEIFMPQKFAQLVNYEDRLKVFDNISIEDNNVYDLTERLGLLSPYQVLRECLKRNQGVLNTDIKFDLHYDKEEKQLQYTMFCGKHEARGKCKNKKLGREYASQTILQKLHPQLIYWGSVLRIYVDEHSVKELSMKCEKPSSPASSCTNEELLRDLKHEMKKVLEKRTTSTSSTGTFTQFMTNIDI